jgi:hypothetical protein
MKVDVVVHTHWDREWYLTRQATLARLQQVMREVLAQLDDGRLPAFLFDGQTVAWRDLLEAGPPELAAGLARHAAAGRLLLGPWYVAADEFLVSGESLLRNLALGIADATAAGGLQRIGYLPDTFGHVAQMPQILAQYGIGAAVVWRGADARHDRFDWRAPDGSTVPTLFLSEGYYLHPLQGPDFEAALATLLPKLAAHRDPGPALQDDPVPLLLMHGGDHLAPTPDLAARVAAWNAAGHGFTLQLGTLHGHAERALAAPGPREVIAGELRANRSAFVLPDVLSSRRALKRRHQQAEDRLLAEVEPLWALARPGVPPPPALEQAWRTLVQQQAHDSICGCSIDPVHEEMAQRFTELDQQLDALRAQALAGARMTNPWRHQPGPDAFADDRRCTLLNPLPQRRAGWFTATLFLRAAEGQRAPAAVAVRTGEGTALPAVLLRCEPAFELVSPLDDFPERLEGHRVELAVQAELPGLGALSLLVEPLPAAAPADDPVEPGVIENAAWRVGLSPDGRIVLHDRLAGAGPVTGAFELLSELDAGDSYTFSPPPRPHAVREARWSLRHCRRIGPVQELQLAATLRQPAGLDARREGAAHTQVDSRGTLRLRLFDHEPLLQAVLDWDNAARDQRTRLLLPGLPADLAQTWSDTAFAWLPRPVRLLALPAERSRAEMPVVVQPSLSAIAAGRWAVLHRALHEHEVVRHAYADGAGGLALALTLVRSVGWLSRRDLLTRGVGAGPDLPTPGAQGLGPDRFEFALLAGAGEAGEAAEARAPAAALAWRRPPLALRGHAAGWPQPVELGNPAVQTSAVIPQPDGRLALRLWNPTAQPQPLALEPADWEPVHADGRPDPQALALVPGRIALRPRGVLTLVGRPTLRPTLQRRGAAPAGGGR